MNDNQASYPQLRFKGFTDPWKQVEFKKLAEIRRGLTYKPTDVQDNGVRVLRSSNIDEDNFVLKSDDVFVKYDAANINEVKNDDILITSANGSSRLVGKHAIIDGINKKTVHGGFMLIARADNPQFTNALMSSNWYKKFINVFVSGGNGAIGNLRKSDLETQKILIPTPEEQTKIGNFFANLDSQITIHQRKLAKLKELKQGYLQKLFPENGSKFPQLRFAGFADAWEERKLIDVAQFNPKTVLPDEFEYVDLESVIGTEMISHRTESKDQAPSRAQRLAKKGDVFYQTVRPYQMNNYLYDLPYDNYVFSTGYAQMRPNIDSYFLLNSVQNKQFVQHVLDRSTGTSYPAINSSDLSNIEINVPSKLAEQQKIGSFFKQVDNTIALHQRKLEKLQELKKGYLQKMFC